MSEHRKAKRAPAKDKPVGDSKAGGETPDRRFAGRSFPEGYHQKGDIDRPPFEGHPAYEENSGRPTHHYEREPSTGGQHGQRPKKDPRSR
jgi:hypothetical protein